MNRDKVLPIDSNTDYSLPGRFEEGNSAYFITPVTKKPKNIGLYVMAIAFVVIAVGSFSYYFVNQSDIDSNIIQNSLILDPEKKIVNQYNVGKYGSDHAHAAIVFFIDNQVLDLSHSQFQLSSKYIHFENQNPFIIHKHATGVPLELLFSSIRMNVSSDCIALNFYSDNKKNFCSDTFDSLNVYINGRKYTSNISNYVISHNDRILISFGDGKSISKQLEYLESIEIFEVPKRVPRYSGDGITI